MRFVGCQTCKTVVQLGGEEEEIKFLLLDNKNFDCITPLCRGRMLAMKVGQIDNSFAITELPVKNFFRAANGFGTGVGDPASLARVKELLLNSKIVGVEAHPIGQPERVIIRELVLDSGIRLHFESSAKGACIYYIEEPGPSCREVVENELAADASAESSSSDREEIRRTVEDAGEVQPLDIWDNTGGAESGAAELPDAERVPAVPEASDLPTSGVPRPSGSGDH